MGKEILMETRGKEGPFLPLAAVNNAQRMKQPSLHLSCHSEEGTEAENDRAKAAPTPLWLQEVTWSRKDRSAPLEYRATIHYSPYITMRGSEEDLRTTLLAQKYTSVPLQYQLV